MAVGICRALPWYKQSSCSDHWNFVFVCIFFFFLFSTQNQLPQIAIGQGLVIYYIKALSVVIRTPLQNFEKIFPVSRKTAFKFVIFRLIRGSKQAYISLFMLNWSLEILISL